MSASRGRLLIAEKVPVVANDYSLQDPERVIVVTGPNQGGKTTFARAFGQPHDLAASGGLVPGTAARLFLFDRLLTHFEREETFANLRGKLPDDLARIHAVLTEATPNSVIILNGSSPPPRLRTPSASASRCSSASVSMVSIVAPENPALRTIKIVRRPYGRLSKYA